MVNLIFNMGMSTFRKFKKTIQHMENGDYELAAAELLNSRYAQQVGQRALDVANQLSEK
jgi:lysozyme